ncbi:MAG: hypothetical protein IPG23_13175 [Burkholderiales bacterium]|nr:hypothetical protein [Burkholderiales bacterium]
MRVVAGSEFCSPRAPPLKAALERKGKHVPCPVHGGRDGFRIFRMSRKEAEASAIPAAVLPNGFALLMDQWLGIWPCDPRSSRTGRQQGQP